MSIKDKLANELANASQRNVQDDVEREERKRQAIESFRPIAEALKEIEEEFASIDGLKLRIGSNNARVKLGAVTTLETSFYEWSRGFSVDEANQWGYPSYDRQERKHEFESAEQVIDFFVRECAEFVAKNGTSGAT